MKPPNDQTIQSPTLKLLDALIVLSPYISKVTLKPLEVYDLAKTFLKNLWPLGASMVRPRGNPYHFEYQIRLLNQRPDMNAIFENVTIADAVAVLMYLGDEVDLFVTYISRWIQKFELVAD